MLKTIRLKYQSEPVTADVYSKKHVINYTIDKMIRAKYNGRYDDALDDIDTLASLRTTFAPDEYVEIYNDVYVPLDEYQRYFRSTKTRDYFVSPVQTVDLAQKD